MYVTVSDRVNVNKQSKYQSPVPNKCTSSEKKTSSYNQNTFVDAPLPKTNPWTVNRNAVHIIQSKDVISEKDPIVDKKQILQTQQTIGEYYY